MTGSEQIEIYRQMMRIWRFEQGALREYNMGQMGGWLQLTIGQESIPVVIRSVMRPHDHVLCGFRGLAYGVASGIGMRGLMAELFGKAAGVSKGKGGATTIYSPENHFWGSYPIAAAQTPIGAGLAFALKQRGESGAVFCSLGDGSVNQGSFHESLNLAGLFDLPVVYVIENNHYGFSKSERETSAFKDYLAQRAEGYDIEWALADAGDIVSLRYELEKAQERAQILKRPTVLEVATYRCYGFSIADAGHKDYRTSEEIDFHKAYCWPLASWERYLLENEITTLEELKSISVTAKEEVKDAIEFARSAGSPKIPQLTEDVYWEVDNKTEASRQGRYFF